MPHLFLPSDQISSDTARILGADHLHLARVLRARPGEIVTVLDNAGNAYRAVIVTIDKSETVARIEARIEAPPEPTVAIIVAQALGKGDKFEQVIQHGTEAGASAFVPVRAARCVVDIPANKLDDRLSRWRQIAKGAAEQSGRARIPAVHAPMNLAELLKSTEADAESVLLLHPQEETCSLSAVLRGFATPPRSLTIVIGPEGGWSPAEVSAAHSVNVSRVTLGPRVLRTETAALIAISQILYHFENC